MQPNGKFQQAAMPHLQMAIHLHDGNVAVTIVCSREWIIPATLACYAHPDASGFNLLNLLRSVLLLFSYLVVNNTHTMYRIWFPYSRKKGVRHFVSASQKLFC